MATPISNTVQRGGALFVQTSIWLADRNGRKIEKLPFDLPVHGTIDYNEDREIGRSMSLEINDPHRLQPFRDYLIPETELVDAAGNRRIGQWGLFIVTPPSTHLTAARFSGTLEGKDSTWILAMDTVPDGTVIPKGTDSGAAARELAVAVMNYSQVIIPDTGVDLIEDYVPDPGTTRLAAMTKLLEAANWYSPSMTGSGAIESSKAKDLSTAQPSRRYSTKSDNVTIVPPIDGDPDWGRLRNRITVRNIAPDRAPIYGTAEVANPDSPIYPYTLGGESNRPLWMSETIDDSEVPDNDAAIARARVLLSEAASYYMPLKIQTLIDLNAGAHDVIELDIDHQGATYTGNWIRRAWSVALKGITSITTSDVNRNEQWQG